MELCALGFPRTFLPGIKIIGTYFNKPDKNPMKTHVLIKSKLVAQEKRMATQLKAQFPCLGTRRAQSKKASKEEPWS